MNHRTLTGGAIRLHEEKGRRFLRT